MWHFYVKKSKFLFSLEKFAFYKKKLQYCEIHDFTIEICDF